MSDNGKNLIFLISQPRSGSTLAQRILGSHPEVYTHSEPWVLLHPLHAFKSNNIHTPYESDLYSTALKGFIKTIPGGDKSYIKEISRVYSNFYDTILKNNGKNLFLDKTPRYYYIIEELKQYFPKAKFVFLWRNPAAVIASIMNSWTKENWYRLAWHKDDLLFAPNEMISGIKFLGTDAYTFSYESLISDPVTQISQLCKFLGIQYFDKMIDYGKNSVVKWEFGDQNTINEKERPDSAHANSWISGLKKIQFWRVVRDYISMLGSDMIAGMGYSISDIQEILEKNRPKGNIDQQSLPLSSFLDNTRDAVIENKRMSNQIKSLIENLRLKDDQINQRTQVFQKVENELNNANLVLRQKDELLKRRDETIAANNAIIKTKDEQLKQKDELLNKRNETIKQNDELLNKRYETIKLKDEVLSQRNDTIKLKDELLSQRNETIKQKDELINQRNDTIKQKDHLMAQINELIIRKTEAVKQKEDLIIVKDKLLQQQNEMIARQLKELQTKEILINQLNQQNSKNELRVKEQNDINEVLKLEMDSLRKQSQKTIAELDKIRLQSKKDNELLLANSNALREKSKNLLILEETLKKRDELIRNIEKSYTLKVGKLIAYPIKKILGR